MPFEFGTYRHRSVLEGTRKTRNRRATAWQARRGTARGARRKLPSGRWQASYVGPDDQRHTADATFPVKRAAEGWLSSERDLIDLATRSLGVWTPPAERAVKAIAANLTFRTDEGWLEHKTLAPHTRRSYEQALRLFILPMLGGKALTDITAEDVRMWFAGMGNDQETRRARAYGVLTAILNTAVDDGLIDRSPARIKGGTAVRRTKRSVVLLEPAELTALAEAARRIAPDRAARRVVWSAPRRSICPHPCRHCPERLDGADRQGGGGLRPHDRHRPDQDPRVQPYGDRTDARSSSAGRSPLSPRRQGQDSTAVHRPGHRLISHRGPYHPLSPQHVRQSARTTCTFTICGTSEA